MARRPPLHLRLLYSSRFALDGNAETVATVPGQPSGLGFLPDGRLLIVSMRDRKILRREPMALSCNTPICPASHHGT